MMFTKLPLIGLIFAIAATLINHSSTAATEIIGDCGELSCAELFAQLKSSWNQEIREYETQCQGDKRLGLDTYGDGVTRKVSLICWENLKRDSYYEGQWLGVLPYPGYKPNFGSKWDCQSSQECADLVEQLRYDHPRKMRSYEIECGIKSGTLRLLLTPKTANIQCIFFVPGTQFDAEGDGISDGEVKPTGVDYILGSFPQKPPK